MTVLRMTEAEPERALEQLHSEAEYHMLTAPVFLLLKKVLK